MEYENTEFDDINIYDDSIELPDELSYSFTSLQIHKSILKEWKLLKKVLPLEGEIKDKIDEFDKLLNYFFE